MPISNPYYNLHQLTLGQYTDGNEFVTDDGADYIGLYHIIPTGKRFSGARPEPTSVELLVKRLLQTNDSKVYNKITNSDYPNYVNPILLTPNPSTDDFKVGQIERYFVQKRNNPRTTIIEINSNQFNKINTTNKPGINGIIWNKLLINWKISKIPIDDAKFINYLTLVKAENKFPYISQYLTNTLEYYK